MEKKKKRNPIGVNTFTLSCKRERKKERNPVVFTLKQTFEMTHLIQEINVWAKCCFFFIPLLNKTNITTSILITEFV